MISSTLPKLNILIPIGSLNSLLRFNYDEPTFIKIGQESETISSQFQNCTSSSKLIRYHARFD
ncbi:hypothetical protein MJO28_008572 [Puccinia striiformis f. sp. tritici]|uniref:Uncharacterized protein n=2 Tax=Puccinia striiformis f. sp. tritici TaxID=168172 RepID=A0ACC0DNZ9_9BASI|nr:hypothetical protein MJO28_017364 [Puccinia striiformis f. sp. tritici]KAI7936624.1 hypothetical protein MJO28_015523 [Puccinia striiformis f. sp. tritici]KAI7949751.1 hypothetical protein MJO28_008572 [Puccinia striiformis f. sp. tritici]